MINAQDIKIGTAIRMDGKLYFCIDFLHVKPGKGNTFMRTKLKDVVNGYVLERRFNIGEKLEDVRVERRPHQYLYMEGADYIFMNQETFDQIPIAHDLINGVDFLLEGMVVDVVSDASTETVLFADVPVKVQMKITYTEPGLKGDTATNTLKPATVESGAIVRVIRCPACTGSHRICTPWCVPLGWECSPVCWPPSLLLSLPLSR